MSLTTNLGLDVPARGADVGTWDVPVNGDFSILDACAGSVANISLASATKTLSAAEARVAILRISGNLVSLNTSVTITLPTSPAADVTIKSWIVDNQTRVGGSVGFIVTLSGGSGNVIALPPGPSTVYWDGTNMNFCSLPPVGTYLYVAATATPTWITGCTVRPYVLCDGSTFNTAVYPQLSDYLGGATLPDLRGRGFFTANGGTGRITSAGSGIDGDTLLSAGGAQTLTLAQANLPNIAPTFSGVAPGTISAMVRSSGNTNQVNVAPAGSTGVIAASSTDTDITLPTPTGTVSSINGNTTQTAANKMPPACIGGIILIKAI